MDGIRSLPSTSSDYQIEYQIDNQHLRKSYPLCPPKPVKTGRRRVIYKPDHVQANIARALFFKIPVSLSRIYNPNIELSYFDQMFIINFVVGEGSFGKVFQVISREDGKVYAIKQFKNEKDRNFGLAEVRNFEKIGEHRNCVKYFLSWEESSIVYIQMECGQMTLTSYLYCAIAHARVIELLYDILSGLNYLHQKNLIHLDVKPENIIISKGYYKLADFGLLVDLNEEKHNKVSSLSDGDSKYLAIEVLDRIYTYACDIFSFGISMLAIITKIPLPICGPEWKELRCGKIPSSYNNVLNQQTTPEIAHIINQMMLIHHARPTAEIILNYPIFARNKELKEPRKYRVGWCSRISYSAESNSFVETPKRNFFTTPEAWPGSTDNEEIEPIEMMPQVEDLATKQVRRIRLFR